MNQQYLISPQPKRRGFMSLLGAIVVLLAFAWLMAGLVRAQVSTAPKSILVPAYRIQITDNFEGYQFSPIAGYQVIFYLERIQTAQGRTEWVIDQIAGPWGNSRGLADPDIEFDTDYAPEFMIAFQEAQRIGLWLGGFTDNFEWIGHTLDVRDYIRNLTTHPQ